MNEQKWPTVKERSGNGLNNNSIRMGSFYSLFMIFCSLYPVLCNLCSSYRYGTATSTWFSLLSSKLPISHFRFSCLLTDSLSLNSATIIQWFKSTKKSEVPCFLVLYSSSHGLISTVVCLPIRSPGVPGVYERCHVWSYCPGNTLLVFLGRF